MPEYKVPNPPTVCQSDPGLRGHLVDAVEQLAGAIDRGECQPLRIELHALAVACDEHQLPIEAARVRRWLRVA